MPRRRGGPPTLLQLSTHLSRAGKLVTTHGIKFDRYSSYHSFWRPGPGQEVSLLDPQSAVCNCESGDIGLKRQLLKLLWLHSAAILGAIGEENRSARPNKPTSMP